MACLSVQPLITIADGKWDFTLFMCLIERELESEVNRWGWTQYCHAWSFNFVNTVNIMLKLEPEHLGLSIILISVININVRLKRVCFQFALWFQGSVTHKEKEKGKWVLGLEWNKTGLSGLGVTPPFILTQTCLSGTRRKLLVCSMFFSTDLFRCKIRV